jgi:hypothetical protein
MDRRCRLVTVDSGSRIARRSLSKMRSVFRCLGYLSEIVDLKPSMLIRNTYRIVRKLREGRFGAVFQCAVLGRQARRERGNAGKTAEIITADVAGFVESQKGAAMLTRPCKHVRPAVTPVNPLTAINRKIPRAVHRCTKRSMTNRSRTARPSVRRAQAERKSFSEPRNDDCKSTTSVRKFIVSQEKETVV